MSNSLWNRLVGCLVVAAMLGMSGCKSTSKPPQRQPPTQVDQHLKADGTPSSRRAAVPPPPVQPPPTMAGTDDCSKPGAGKTYEVGDGKAHEGIGDVPWETLASGDTVRIHWRARPYREKILISSRGTPDAPIRVCGIPGPNGERPIVDGKDATTRPEAKYPYAGTQDRGLVTITRDSSDRYGFKPGYLVIQGLELRNADQQYSFTDGAGKKRGYTRNAAALFVERGEHITIRGCAIHGSGNGVFVASGGDEASLSRQITVEWSHVYGNGNVGSEREHNAYTESSGMVFQYNQFGPPREGALGNNIKDRSAGTVVRYNWIEGGAHLVQMVEAEESTDLMRKEPDFDRTYIYGNVLLHDENGSSNVLHYGGDTGLTDIYRNGILFFYHNTVVVDAPSEKLYLVSIFRLSNANQTVAAHNNIFHKRGTALLSLMRREGKAKLGKNWIVDGWREARRELVGTIEGKDLLIVGAEPGFANPATFELAKGSPCVDVAEALPPSIPGEHHVTHDPKGKKREILGKALDLGAFEASR